MNECLQSILGFLLPRVLEVPKGFWLILPGAVTAITGNELSVRPDSITGWMNGSTLKKAYSSLAHSFRGFSQWLIVYCFRSCDGGVL